MLENVEKDLPGFHPGDGTISGAVSSVRAHWSNSYRLSV